MVALQFLEVDHREAVPWEDQVQVAVAKIVDQVHNHIKNYLLYNN